MKRQQKKLPRRFLSDYIKTDRTPDVLVLKEGVFKNGKRVPTQQIFANRDRVRADTGPRHNKTPLGLGGPIGVSSTWTQSKEIDDWRHRSANLFRAWASQTGRGHGYEEFHSVRHLTMRGNYKYFFHGIQWFWVEYSDDWSRELRQSIMYQSKASLMLAFRLNVIKWLEPKS